ncbi:MAG: binding protein 15 [Sphingomonadales bacterium]|nr:binding protein 15 [Sphingomonadales bacterium]
MVGLESTDTVFDVVIVGSGAGGLTAATVAAQRGLKVLVIEKTAVFGGTTAISGGGLWIPNNPKMAGLGLADTRGQAVNYIQAITGNFYEEGNVAAFLQYGPEMVRYLEENTEVSFMGGLIPDYEPDQSGATTGRTLLTVSYDGRKLGSRLLEIRPALDQFGVFGGMQIGFEDAAPFLSVLRSAKAFRYSARVFGRYLWDRIRHGRATRLVNGNALVARLFQSATLSGAVLWNNAAVVRLVKRGGRVVGVVVQRHGREFEVLANCGVILASGGYGANQAMRRENVPMPDEGWSLQPPGNTGDGIRLGENAGGVFVRENVANGIWAPMSSMVSQSGIRTNFSHIMLDRHCPGFIVVNMQGKRFVNEGTSYQAFCKAMHNNDVSAAWLIGTHKGIRRYSMGLAKAAPLPIGKYISNGYLKKGNTLTDLAEQIEIEPNVLAATVDRFNVNAEQGQDPDFGRGQDQYSRAQGDQEHRPNPSLGALRSGPFYAVKLHPGELSTLNGLRTTPDSQVVEADGNIVSGLYAIGADANSVFAGAYPGGGASLGPTMTFAYIAANHIASQCK